MVETHLGPGMEPHTGADTTAASMENMAIAPRASAVTRTVRRRRGRDG
ncbi:hypothetical protein N9L76_07440 [bacterium]|nr:hypothetical protein [bacterium]